MYMNPLNISIPLKKVKIKDLIIFVIWYLYYEIVNDKTKYPKCVPFVDLPFEMIEFLIKKIKSVLRKKKP